MGGVESSEPHARLRPAQEARFGDALRARGTIDASRDAAASSDTARDLSGDATDFSATADVYRVSRDVTSFAGADDFSPDATGFGATGDLARDASSRGGADDFSYGVTSFRGAGDLSGDASFFSGDARFSGAGGLSRKAAGFGGAGASRAGRCAGRARQAEAADGGGTPARPDIDLRRHVRCRPSRTGDARDRGHDRGRVGAHIANALIGPSSASGLPFAFVWGLHVALRAGPRVGLPVPPFL